MVNLAEYLEVKLRTLKPYSQNVWIYEGETVHWHGMPYSTRMTVIELPNKKLWIHSPSKITDLLLEDIAALGEPAYLVSPNKIHHLYLKEWEEIFPRALLYAPPGLVQKRRDIDFDRELVDAPEKEWAMEIDQLIFRGSPAMEEVVFFHRPSGTLILADLIENFPAGHFRGIRKAIAKMTGIVSPDGKTPLDWRLTFLFGKNKARKSVDKMLAWQPKKIIIAHGECIDENAAQFVEKSFRWM